MNNKVSAVLKHFLWIEAKYILHDVNVITPMIYIYIYINIIINVTNRTNKYFFTVDKSNISHSYMRSDFVDL